MRLCVVASPNSIHSHRWVRHFADRGHQIYLIGVSPSAGVYPSTSMPAGVRFFDLRTQFDVRKARYLVWAVLARRMVHQIQPDVLHAHQVAGDGWVGASASYHPFLVTAWGSDLLVSPRRSAMQRSLARWVLRRADYVTCVSEELIRAATALGAVPDRLEFVPWGVDTHIFHPAKHGNLQAMRIQLRLGECPTMLSLRPVRSIYNPLDIAQAIPRVLSQVPEARFIVRTYSCDPRLLAEFQTIVREHGAENTVQYLGDLPDETEIAHLYRSVDVAVSVPSSDGTPSSVLEALACGTPVVLSDLPTLHHWIEHEREGLYVPLGDVQALSDAVVRLLTDSASRSRMAENGLQMIRQCADSRVWMRRSEEIYEMLARQA